MKTPQKKAGASVIFLNSSNHVLLLLRDDKKEIDFPNRWDLLGGHVERDETPWQCIHREMLEEIELELDHPVLFRTYDMEDRWEYTFWQHAELTISSLVLHEGQRLKWFSEKEIQAMADDEFAFDFRGVLLDFFEARPWQAR